ncbi:TMhelix containing protein [Vibrio phage 1.287.O._10N.286.55.C7]|nr:TMhelix containing protein [Vibrio phage 1.287.O._10N.286.55.C7]AUS01660.1 TMhelix containing protein [Vibrio phage 1.289.A._10N.286.55.E8]
MKLKSISTSILDMLLGALILSAAISLYGMYGNYEHPIEESAEYEVTCVDDILTGRFLFIDGQYFRHGATKATWIPLKQCGLEPVEAN